MAVSRRLWILASCNALLAAGYAFSMPFFAIYLASAYDLPLSGIGAFLSFSMLSTAVSLACGGEISDQIGRKKMMLLAVFSRAFSVLGISAAIYFHVHYLWIFALHLLMGLTGNLFTPAADAWIADNVEPRRRVAAFGRMRIGINLGWALGPMAGGFLTAQSYPLAFAVSGVTYIITGLIVLYAIDDARGQVLRSANFRDMLSELKNRRFAAYCFYAFLLGIVMAQLVVGISLFAMKYRGFSQSGIGLLFSVNGLIVVVLQHPAVLFLERFRITSGVLAGCLLYAAGYVIVGYGAVYGAMLAGVVIFSLGEIAVSPGLSALAANMAPPRHKGRYLGMQGVMRQAGGALGVFLGGTGLEYITPYWLEGMWVLVGVIALVSGLGFHSLRHRLAMLENGMTGKNSVPEPPPELN
ncbi:MAG: MFS transporter [Elusimicrobiaceae bacterium]|nr:MFS transporter [Elusimicrobiaceae bacterium]